MPATSWQNRDGDSLLSPRILSGTNLERAGDHNQRVTLQAIRVHGLVTRAELSEYTGLTNSAIANITKRLLSDQVIMEVGRRHGVRGQPAMRLVVNPDGCFSLGINIDRGKATIILLDLLGNVRYRSSGKVESASPEAVASRILFDIRSLLDGNELFKSRLLGVGVTIPDDLGRVSLPHWPNDEAWQDVDIPRLFRDLRPFPIFIENDATAAALGELQFGHGLRHPSFFYILICGGLGGGLVIDGQYCHGATGRSGEIGFLPIHAPGTAARSLQEVVSLFGLYEALAEDGYRISQPDQLLELDERGQAAIGRWMDAATALLIEPLLGVNCLLNPGAIYLSGDLPVVLLDGLAERLNRSLLNYAEAIPAIAPVQRALMASDAAAIGAALLPFSHLLLPSRAALVKAALPAE